MGFFLDQRTVLNWGWSENFHSFYTLLNDDYLMMITWWLSYPHTRTGHGFLLRSKKWWSYLTLMIMSMMILLMMIQRMMIFWSWLSTDDDYPLMMIIQWTFFWPFGLAFAKNKVPMQCPRCRCLSMPSFIKIGPLVRPWKSGQTDRQTDIHTSLLL